MNNNFTSDNSIIESLQKMGFSLEDIKTIRENTILTLATTYKNLQILFKFLKEKKYPTKNIIKMIVTSPNICYSANNIEEKYLNLRQLGYTPHEIIRITTKAPIVYARGQEAVINNNLLLIELGYTYEEIMTMIKKYPKLLELSKENIKTKYIDLERLGYTKEEVIKMTRIYPTLYGYDIITISNKFKDYMEKFNYSYEEVLKITKNCPKIYGYDIDTIMDKADSFESLGYTPQNILEMIKIHPSFCEMDLETLNKKTDIYLSLGYTKEEIIKMGLHYPQIYDLSYSNTYETFLDLRRAGYTKEEVIRITIQNPTLYGTDNYSLLKKIAFYDSIGLHQLIIESPCEFRQSVEVSYAKYCYYLANRTEITSENCGKLFLGNKAFESKYGLTKEELLTKYNYEENLSDGELTPIRRIRKP